MMSMLFLAGCASQSPNQDQTTTTLPEGAKNVAIKDFSFNPAELTINQGDTVVWTNQDAAPHRIISDSGTEINSETLSSGQAYSHKFKSPGTYDYHCSIHPSMKGTIIVN